MATITLEDNHAKVSQCLEKANLDLQGIWSETAEAYFLKLIGNRSHQKKTSKGMQSFLNACIEERLVSRGWVDNYGWFRHGNFVLRISFRHKMSMGSDFFDAVRLLNSEGVENVLLVYLAKDDYEVVNSDEQSTLCSFEQAVVLKNLTKDIIGDRISVGRFNLQGVLEPNIHKEIYSKARLDSPRGPIL